MNAAKKILIVEDEVPMAKALELKLNKSGFQAKAVTDGKQAVDIIGTENFDLVLLDILMPELDGFGVLQHLKDSKAKVPPVIITSNLSQQEDIAKAKSLGAVDFLVKSNASLGEIVDRVKLTLSQQRPN